MNEPNEIDVNPYATPQASSAAGDAWVRSGQQSLRKVALGISLVYYGIVLALVAIIVMVLAAILSNLMQSPAILMVGGGAAAVMIVVAAILNFVGQITCGRVSFRRACHGNHQRVAVFEIGKHVEKASL